MKPRVVKVGGRPLGDAEWLAGFAAEAARSDTPLLVVHGGGPEIDALSTRLGVEVERRDGLRVTTPEGLSVTEMVLSGTMNKRLVGSLLNADLDAIGLSGKDGSLVMARVAANGTLGRVGEVVEVRARLLEELIGLGLTPVISPVSRATDGGALNVNADDVAVAVATAVKASELIFLTDVSAVRDGDGADLDLLGPDRAEELLAAGVIRDGMAVKVRAGLRGLGAGLGAVRIGGIEVLTDPEAGTRITAASTDDRVADLEEALV